MKPAHLQLIIKPKEGINDLRFGATMLEAEKHFGKPQTVETIDDIEEYRSIVWHYWEYGFSLFFDDNMQNTLSCLEVDNRDALLWGKKVFELTEKEIVSLFKGQGSTLVDSENHEWGEKRVSFDDMLTDLYFEKTKLMTINCSAEPNEDNLYIYPN